ncbi:MAG TPA: hypothetical protein VGR93_07505 [Candidatus Acidoferrales bacterium]|nr:hypothetical protein [Candidatus Acidoferrales bacterium]
MRCGIIGFLFLLNAAPAFAQSQYFPKGIFEDKVRASWYSNQLKALEEPSLWGLSQSGKQAVVYRFLWLRTFHHPVAIRVVIAPDGTADLITKVSGGAGGYGPGPLIENQTKRLSAIEVRELAEQVNNANFWKLPTEEKQTSFGMDGAQWILEGVKDGNYHLVDRWSPKSGTYRAVCLFFVRQLARLRIPRDQVY